MTARSGRLVPGFLLAGVLLLGPVASRAADPPAGRIKTVQGSAVVVRGDQAIAAREGDAVAEQDTLRTGADGRLGVTLQDGTRLSLGPDSEIRIERVLFEPARGRLAMAIRWARGMLAYASGRIARLSPESVQIQTPSAIIGVRGTRFVGHVEPE